MAHICVGVYATLIKPQRGTSHEERKIVMNEKELIRVTNTIADYIADSTYSIKEKKCTYSEEDCSVISRNIELYITRSIKMFNQDFDFNVFSAPLIIKNVSIKIFFDKLGSFNCFFKPSFDKYSLNYMIIEKNLGLVSDFYKVVLEVKKNNQSIMLNGSCAIALAEEATDIVVHN